MFGQGPNEHRTGRSVASDGIRIALRLTSRSSPTMTLNSTNASSSIFKDGRLKPGIYKIQNLYSETYLDIHQHSKQVCCRPARDLEEGRGLVRMRPLPVARVLNTCKWEIKGFGVGYTVQRVSFLFLSDLLSAAVL